MSAEQTIELLKFIDLEYNTNIIYPPKEQIFAAFQQTDYDQVKVVILGQDPYHQANQANGLAFAVSDNFFPKPPSLRRILDEVERDCGHTIDRHNSSLRGWTKQGVLLLNTILTVKQGVPLSHSKRGWEQFTDHVIQTLAQRTDPIIFLLWGKHAQNKETLLVHSSHIILKAPHPSPLARGFQGCGHFSRVNQILTSMGKTPIDWEKVTT
jgi:uracil-DNA glycosylase